MTFLRSLLFMASLIAMTPPFIVVLLLLAWLPKRQLRRLSMIWVDTAIWLIRHLLGIDYRLINAENIPNRSCVILSKHQSAWETIVLQRIFAWTSFVYKRELHWLPFFGWGLYLMPFVAIDRAAGKDALNRLATRGKQRLDGGYSVIIFPEGTRTTRQPVSPMLGSVGLIAQGVHEATGHRHGQHRPAHCAGRAVGGRYQPSRRGVDRKRNAKNQPRSLPQA